MPMESMPDVVKRAIKGERGRKVFRAAYAKALVETKDEGKAMKAGLSAAGKCGHLAKELVFEIAKADSRQHLVFGWLSVMEKADGSSVEDADGDTWADESELEKAAYTHVLASRKAGDRHRRDDAGRKVFVGDLVECVAFTKEKQAAMGIPPGVLPVGIWVGYHVPDDGVFAKVDSGEYRSFSLGGFGRRED